MSHQIAAVQVDRGRNGRSLVGVRRLVRADAWPRRRASL